MTAKRRTSMAMALVLGLFAAYTVVAVALAISSDKPHGRVFWPTVVIMLVLAAWLARRAYRLAQRARP
jgi:hypothetical protein